MLCAQGIGRELVILMHAMVMTGVEIELHPARKKQFNVLVAIKLNNGEKGVSVGDGAGSSGEVYIHGHLH